VKTIVLAGAGHANIVLVRRLAGFSGARVVLVNDGRFAWYTGALPALIRGDVPADAARIDNVALANACAAEFVDARFLGFDERAVHLADRPPIGFDFLVVSTGGAGVPGGVKPIPALLERIKVLAARAAPKVGILGGGAAGVELALALRVRLGPAAGIFVGAETVLPAAPRRVRQIAASAMQKARIAVARDLPAGLDDVIHAYTPVPALAVGADLRVAGYNNVFAAGDAARFTPLLPRSGAMAVRQGRLIERNLRRALRGQRLVPFMAPDNVLAILSLDSTRAVAWYGGLSWSGRGPMRVKRWLDGRWK
jgi:selenide,water dikinase